MVDRSAGINAVSGIGNRQVLDLPELQFSMFPKAGSQENGNLPAISGTQRYFCHVPMSMQGEATRHIQPGA